MITQCNRHRLITAWDFSHTQRAPVEIKKLKLETDFRMNLSNESVSIKRSTCKSISRSEIHLLIRSPRTIHVHTRTSVEARHEAEPKSFFGPRILFSNSSPKVVFVLFHDFIGDFKTSAFRKQGWVFIHLAAYLAPHNRSGDYRPYICLSLCIGLQRSSTSQNFNGNSLLSSCVFIHKQGLIFIKGLLLSTPRRLTL